jgi:predicted nuclease of predicted toxin-antitoxin system
MMRLKVDEDLPQVAVEMLRDRGYEALSVVEQGMAGLKDHAIYGRQFRPNSGSW